jgi:hypothetical protein
VASGELYRRVGFIVTNLARPAAHVVAFYNQAQRSNGSRRAKRRSNGPGCGAAPLPPTRCAANSRAAYNLGNLMRTLAMPETAEAWPLTSLCERLIKIGAKVVSDGRSRMAEVAVSRQMFADILSLIARLRAPPAPT